MTTAHALNASAFAGAKVTPARGARSSAVGRKSVVTRAMAVKTKTLSIPKTFEELKRRGQCAFIPFICAGDGGIDTTEKAVRILDEVGRQCKLDPGCAPTSTRWIIYPSLATDMATDDPR